jgi:serine protease Do
MALVTTWSEDSNGVSAGACGFAGSGALLANGYVLTANHVIAADNSIDVPSTCDWDNVLVMFIDNAEEAPSRWYKAEIVATDERRDVALLKITAAVADAPDVSTLPALTIYSETSSPTLGMQLVFMGYPGVGGDTLSLSTGMVSGYDQLEDGTRTLKTDAVLSGGSSGGPGIDGTGRIVGKMSCDGKSNEDFEAYEINKTNFSLSMRFRTAYGACTSSGTISDIHLD